MAQLLHLRSGMFAGLLVLALMRTALGPPPPPPPPPPPDPYHNQGPLIFLVKDLHKPAPARLEWPDRALQFGSTALILADWLTTIDGLRKGYPESNPILGIHPSLGRANLLIGTGALANALLTSRIKDPELRRGIWAAMIVLEMKAVHGNRAAGCQFNFRM